MLPFLTKWFLRMPLVLSRLSAKCSVYEIILPGFVNYRLFLFDYFAKPCITQKNNARDMQ